MDKREVYEHLARYILTASSKKETKNHLRLYSKFVIGFVFLIGITKAYLTYQKANLGIRDCAFVLMPAKINFNFNPAKKESFINLNP